MLQAAGWLLYIFPQLMQQADLVPNSSQGAREEAGRRRVGTGGGRRGGGGGDPEERSQEGRGIIYWPREIRAGW